MQHLDFTIDFETCSLSANAAPIQVAIVPWVRDFDNERFAFDEVSPFVGYVDLRTCVVEGFDFDPSTIKWWSERTVTAKEAICREHPKPVKDVTFSVLEYIRNIKEKFSVSSICLWCQGEDVDIAVLRNLCHKYDMKIEDVIPHTSFRDCRTVILEAAIIEAEKRMKAEEDHRTLTVLPSELYINPNKAYSFFPPLPTKYHNGSEAHDALYDAWRSSWNTWHALRWLSGRQ